MKILFSQTVLHQHGCFLVAGKPYEVEIISNHETIIRRESQTMYTAVAEEFRFYTPHITRFYNRDGKIVKEYPPVQVLTLHLEQIQPLQFFAGADKIAAVRSFIQIPWISLFRYFQTKIVLFRRMEIPDYTMR